jgi:hypothetical protein
MHFLMDVLLGWIEKSQEDLAEKIRLLDVTLELPRCLFAAIMSR